DCGNDCTQTYQSATMVTLTATPTAGSVFTGWLGACTGIGQCNVNVNGTTSVTATFASLFDVDGNGQVDALTDGLMLLRYMFGVRGQPLIAGAIGAGATRTPAAQLQG